MRGTGEGRSRAAVSQTGGRVAHRGGQITTRGTDQEGREDAVTTSGTIGKKISLNICLNAL